MPACQLYSVQHLCIYTYIGGLAINRYAIDSPSRGNRCSVFEPYNVGSNGQHRQQKFRTSRCLSVSISVSLYTCIHTYIYIYIYKYICIYKYIEQFIRYDRASKAIKDPLALARMHLLCEPVFRTREHILLIKLNTYLFTSCLYIQACIRYITYDCDLTNLSLSAQYIYIYLFR